MNVLSFIREEMLSNPNVDAQFIYMATHLAEEDGELHSLLNRWMKDIDNRNNTEEAITDRVNYLLDNL